MDRRYTGRKSDNLALLGHRPADESNFTRLGLGPWRHFGSMLERGFRRWQSVQLQRYESHFCCLKWLPRFKALKLTSGE